MRGLLVAAALTLSFSGCKPPGGVQPATSSPEENGLVLVEKGQSPHTTIVVAPNSLATPKAAAEELQRLVEAATGQRWPIAAEPSADGVNVIVGPHPLAEAAGIHAAELPNEGFRIAVRGNTLFIVGHDTKGDPWDMHWLRACQTGTLSGVVGFARKFFHARWLLPGPEGEILQKRDRLVIPADLDISESPGFASRKILAGFECQSAKDRARFFRFNRLGWSHPSCYWHNWFQTISPEVYGKEHPEWFALVNGNRITRLHNGSHGGQLCVSNPEVIRKMADIAVEEFKKNPANTVFSISENDGGKHCECANCRALDVEDWHPGLPSLSERFAHFANAVREQIGDRAPGLTIGYYAYHQGELPTVHTRLLPGIRVSDVTNGYDVHYQFPERRSRQHKMMDAWRRSGAEMEMVSYFHGMPWWSLPTFSPEALADLIQTAAQYPSSTGFWIGLSDGAFGTTGNEWFLAAELLWNPGQNVEAILDDFYTTGFGSAAGPVRAYFDLIRVSFARAAAQLPFSEDETHPDTWVLPTFDPIRAEADQLIARARATADKTDDPHLRTRIGYVANGWEWTKIQCDVLRAITAYRKEPSRNKAGEIVELLTRREAFIAKHGRAGDYTFNWLDVKETDFGRAFPVNRSEYEMAYAGNVKSVAISEGGKPVTLEMVENRSGGKPIEPTHVTVSYGTDALHVAFEVFDSNPDKLLANVTQRDGEVWNDDSVEIFLKPRRSSPVCYQLLINPAGTLCDIRHDGKADFGWDSGATVTAARTPEGWKTLVAIPYKSLGLNAPPLPGDIWGLNLTRSRHGSGEENSAWSPTFGLFFRPERFGEIVFTKTPDAP